MTRPIELYKFVHDADEWHQTSGDEAVTYLGDDYEPTPIGRRGEIEQGEEINRANLPLTVAHDHPVVDLFRGQAPDTTVSITIYRQTDAGTAVIYKGRVSGTGGSGSERILECESIFSTLRRPGLRAHFSKLCRHALYHGGCPVDPDAVKVVALCTAVSGVTITVPDASDEADGWYLGGMVAFGGVLRYVTGHSGSTLTLTRPLIGLADAVANAGWGKSWGRYWGGSYVAIYPGCDRALDTCRNKFNVVIDNGGFYWLPSRNPLDGNPIV